MGDRLNVTKQPVIVPVPTTASFQLKRGLIQIQTLCMGEAGEVLCDKYSEQSFWAIKCHALKQYNRIANFKLVSSVTKWINLGH